jgi:hypothetical protein
MKLVLLAIAVMSPNTCRIQVVRYKQNVHHPKQDPLMLISRVSNPENGFDDAILFFSYQFQLPNPSVGLRYLDV